MHRAILPVGVGLGGGGYLLQSWFRTWAASRASHLVVELVSSELLDLGVKSLGQVDWAAAFRLGSIFLLWEFRSEISSLFQIVLSFLLLCLTYLHLALGIVCWAARVVLSHLGRIGEELRILLPRSERGESLTCMAVVAAGAGAGPAQQPFPIGSFVLVARPPHWDEVWIAGYIAGTNDVLARTTVPDGSDWIWVVVKLVGLAVKAPVVGAGGGRSSPPGVPADSVNWIYTPPACAQLWEPDAMETASLTSEATLILSNLNSSTAGVTINTAGTGGDLMPLTLAPLTPIGPGGAAVAQAGGAAGLGLGGGPQNALDLKALEKAIQELQLMATGGDSRQKDKEKKKKKKKRSRERSSKKSRKKKKKKRRSDSSSSSRSSRSRSRSSSSSTSSSGKKKGPLAWQEKGKDQKVSYEDLCHVDQLRLKKRGDLVSFATKNPGALTAHFLAGVYARLSKGTVTRSSQLRDASVTAWAHQHAGLSEPRDIKEVLTLAEILDNVNRKEIARALDILVQRIVAIQSARAKGGSWEKAEALELVSTQRSMASTSMLALTNS